MPVTLERPPVTTDGEYHFNIVPGEVVGQPINHNHDGELYQPNSQEKNSAPEVWAEEDTKPISLRERYLREAYDPDAEEALFSTPTPHTYSLPSMIAPLPEYLTNNERFSLADSWVGKIAKHVASLLLRPLAMFTTQEGNHRAGGRHARKK